MNRENHSLKFEADIRRLYNGLSFLANYALSRSIDLDSAGAGSDQNQRATDTSRAGQFTVLRANRLAGGNLPRGEANLRPLSRHLRLPSAPPRRLWDMRTKRDHRTRRQQHALQFRAEFFDLFNHTQFFAPGAVVDTPAFGRIASARSPRNVQLGLKLNF
jgi:hypothetical protein